MLKYKKTFFPLFFSIILFSSPVLAKVEIVPIVNVNLLGGRYHFGADPASLGYNLNVDAIPAVKFSDKLSLIPLVSFNRYGIKDVTELVGGGTLYQQRQNILGGGKLVFSPSEKLKIKANGSYKADYFITTGETWGKGLFDYTKWTLGGEVETIIRETNENICESISVGYNYYGTGFSNYESLVAKYGDEFSELQQTPGAKVLDYNASEIFSEGSLLLSPKLIAQYNYFLTLKSFPEQYLIDNKGAYSATELRNDSSHTISVNGVYLLSSKENQNLTLNGNVQLNLYNSNQNHYDVGRYKSIPNYYDYFAVKVSPTLGIHIGEAPLNINISYAFDWRSYTERLKQDTEGNYGTDKIFLITNIITGSVSYPVAEVISLRAQINCLIKISNMEYEAVYRYNYTTMNYFAGIVLEF